jgi:hypothetical protein
MDISLIKDNSKGEWLTITLPDGTATDIRLKIISSLDISFISGQKELMRNLFEKKGVDVSDADIIQSLFSDVQFESYILDWENVSNEDKDLSFNKTNLRMFLKQLPFVKMQIQTAILSPSFFIKVSEKPV